MPLLEILDTKRDEIVEKFVREVRRKDLPPDRASTSTLVDHIPLFLKEMCDELEKGNRSTKSEDVEATAREHGEQRWKAGYDLADVIREYGVLRRVILAVAKLTGESLDSEELEVLTEYLDVGITSAAAQYIRCRDEQAASQRANLEFLCEAGELLGTSLDYKSTLAQLTRLLVPRFADYCVLNLRGHSVEEFPIAHVDPAKVEWVRSALRMFPKPLGAPTHARVFEAGRSMLVESRSPSEVEAMAVSSEHAEVLRRLAPQSWMVIPLRVQAEVFGTISLVWSNSNRQYSQSDLLLAEDLGRRASSAIDNARLFELARDERARAEAATRTKDEFVAMVSHELRTPLNVMVGWLRLLRSGSVPEARRDYALEVVERNADAQSQLVADLLDISRALTGRIRLEPAQVDLANLLDLVLEDSRVALDAKRLVLKIDVERGETVMRGDADRLRQVIWNLLLNAVKFTPKGGSISIQLRRVESDLELIVRDTGVGIEAEVLPHIFESFRQADSKATRTYGGLGIGLSIVKYLVGLHGGSVEAASDGPGQGASFTVKLPISPLISSTIGVGKVRATSLSSADDAPFSSLHGTRVLVVDDDEDARDLLRVVLESRGMLVSTAATVRSALQQFERGEFDVLVSDIGLPEEDGYGLIRGVRALADASRATVPAIALTAFARAEDRTRALLEGFNQHLAKPIEPTQLLVAIADLVEHPPASK